VAGFDTGQKAEDVREGTGRRQAAVGALCWPMESTAGRRGKRPQCSVASASSAPSGPGLTQPPVPAFPSSQVARRSTCWPMAIN
jgi:hypothetical protein